MRSQSHWNSLYKVLAGFQVFGSTVVVVISALLKFDAAKLDNGPLDFLKPYVVSLQTNAWWSILSLTLLVGLAKIINGRIGAPWVWDHVHFLLDKFQELLFEGEQGDVHHHRVTLFKHVRCKNWYQVLRRDGGLLSVERSGHTTMKSVAFFRAPDDADNAEGVAGWTWAAKRVTTVENLPDIHNRRGGNHWTQNRAKYAQKTRVSDGWLTKHPDSARARSLCGIPVEVKGRIWGVIVIDSRSPAFRNRTVIDDFWKINSRYFGKLLEKA